MSSAAVARARATMAATMLSPRILDNVARAEHGADGAREWRLREALRDARELVDRLEIALMLTAVEGGATDLRRTGT